MRGIGMGASGSLIVVATLMAVGIMHVCGASAATLNNGWWGAIITPPCILVGIIVEIRYGDE